MAVKVRERPEGSGCWWVFTDHQGKRKAKKVGSKKAADSLARKLEAKLAAGDLGLLENKKRFPVFKEYAEQWLAASKALIKQSTYILYEHLLSKHIMPSLEKMMLDAVTYQDVKALILKKHGEGLAVSTLKSMNAVISGIYSSAIEDSILTVNPATRLGKLFSRLKKQQVRFEISPLNREETALFLETALKHFPVYYPLFLCALRTGMRIGEVVALEWGDIDFNSRFIVVRRSLVKGRLETPKNGKTRRVDMSRQLTDTLKQLKTERKRQALQSGKSDIAGRVFLTAEGCTIDVDNFRYRVFYKLLDKAGLRRIRIHDLRHTYASLLIAQNESLAYIRDQLGHHSIKVTVDTYGHLVPGANKGAVDRLDEGFCSQPSATYPQPEVLQA